MKSLVLCTLLLMANALAAQNWSPIRVNQKMNYQHSDSSYITNTIWVDSAFSESDDSIFYLNRIVKDVIDNSQIALRNQPQFLSKFMTKQVVDSITVYVCAYPYNYFLLPTFGLGYSWDFTNTINAEITGISWEDVFGVMDLVKTVSLSDGNEIRFSKNFGILKFPDFENGGYFELIGIQDTEYGQSVPGFWEIYDFEVGDVFQYSIDHGGPGLGYSEHYTKKYQIDSKTVNPEGYLYAISGIKAGYTQQSNGTFPFSYPFTNELDIQPTNYPYTGYFNNQMLTLEEYFCSVNTDGLAFSRMRVYPDSNNVITKHFGLLLNQYQGNLFYVESPDDDTLIQIPDVTAECFGDFLGNTLARNLGKTLLYSGQEEDMFESHMEGYVVGGDTVGTITPDSVLFVNIHTNLQTENNIILFPNPAKASISVKTLSDQKNNNSCIEIRNLTGKMLEKQQFTGKQTSLSIESLPAGFYIYTIKTHNEVLKTGKLIKQ